MLEKNRLTQCIISAILSPLEQPSWLNTLTKELKKEIYMKNLLMLSTICFSTFSFASALEGAVGVCAGHAKYGALKAYHAEMGTVQGSQGAEHTALLVDNIVSANQASYLVSVTDSNEDNDVWTANYLVQVSEIQSKCKVNSVKKIGVVVAQ